MARERSTSDHVSRLIHAVDHLGIEVVRRKGSALTVRLNNQKLQLDLHTLSAQLQWLGEGAPPESVAVALAATLNLRVPAALTNALGPIAPLLRPVLVRPEELQGPRRSMCRRDAFGPMVLGVAFGPSENAPRVQTAHLDKWGAHFDDVLATAFDNLGAALGEQNVLGVEGTPGLLAIVDDNEPAAGACYLFDTLIPDLGPKTGVLFGVPSLTTTIALPVEPGGGAAAFAALVEMMYSLCDRQTHPLSDQIFWWRGSDISHIPMVEVEEDGVRRIHLDARGIVADLLDVLGEFDEDESSDDDGRDDSDDEDDTDALDFT